jgi:hypothetical protein
MKKFLGKTGAGRLTAVVSLFGLALASLIAVPLIASAGEPGGESDSSGSSVAECDRRANGEHPRAQRFLDELVADGVISADQAAEIDARLSEKHFTACVAHLLFERGNAIRSTASATATEPREVLGALVAGESLSQYAGEHGVDDATLIGAIMASPEAKAAELVAAGEIDQATVDSILAGIESRVTELIQKTDIEPRRRGARAILGG